MLGNGIGRQQAQDALVGFVLRGLGRFFLRLVLRLFLRGGGAEGAGENNRNFRIFPAV